MFRLVTLLFVFLAVSLALAAPAWAQSVVRVPGGSFEETAPGEWTEFARDGSPRYTFQARQDGNTTVLTNASLGVTLWLDRDARAVFGQWPGQPRHRLHTILAPAASKPALTPAPKPSPKPVLDMSKPSAPVTTTTVQVVRASGRHVFRRDPFDVRGWTEAKPDGTRESLRQLATEGSRLYLLGADDRLVVIDLAAQQVLTAAGDALGIRHRILDAATERDSKVSPNPPSIPATELPYTLSDADRTACIVSGGTVERDGILGAERCTRPYPDGGLFCTDSDVCAGSCIAPDTARMGERVAGTCQITDNPFGCYARVEDGRATPTLCVD